jgi:hypothetical protein
MENDSIVRDAFWEAVAAADGEDVKYPKKREYEPPTKQDIDDLIYYLPILFAFAKSEAESEYKRLINSGYVYKDTEDRRERFFKIHSNQLRYSLCIKEDEEGNDLSEAVLLSGCINFFINEKGINFNLTDTDFIDHFVAMATARHIDLKCMDREIAVHTDRLRSADNMTEYLKNISCSFEALKIYHNGLTDKQTHDEKLTKVNIENNKMPQLSTYFNRSFTADEQKNLFGGLIAYGFLPQETIYSHFCHVFGGTTVPDNEKPFEPLMWMKKQALFAYFVYQLFSETDVKFWDASTRCFTIRGREPNIGVMKTEQSKLKNEEKDPPEGSDIIDKIIMNMA